MSGRRLVATLMLMTSCLATQAIQAATKPMHPPVALLDRNGVNVRESGAPVSTMQTCGACHDADYIAGHSYHAQAGANERFAVGTAPGRRAWDYSPGSFGGWNPLIYRYLTPPGDPRLDLGVAEWIQTQGWRHVGGLNASAETPDAKPTGKDASSSTGQGIGAAAWGDPRGMVLDESTRTAKAWDWQASGTVEMNCFLCHTASPDNVARVEELSAGHFDWANTATLASTGAVKGKPGEWTYPPNAFMADGTVSADVLGIQEPTSENCGLCHGQTHFGPAPLHLELNLRQWSTATKGQVFSPQRMSESAVNLEDKQSLGRPWDVHAQALLDCRSCHFSLNNPASYESTPRNRPRHLRFEPRRLSIAEYLERPSHQFAKGQTSQGTVARHLSGTMRGCSDCHDAAATHDWLPYAEAHFARLSCEACHVAEVRAPAVEQVDWTTISPLGEPAVAWRGLDGSADDPASRVTGFRPVLLPVQDLDGQKRLVPHNLVSAWYWVDGAALPRPVRLADLKAALLADAGYRPEILAVLDSNADGALDESERRLDTADKVEAVRNRLIAVGGEAPRIEAEITPYGLHHGVGPSQWATKDCQTCHAAKSRITEPFVLASNVPGGVVPRLVGGGPASISGEVRVEPDGRLAYQPSSRAAGLYVFGHDRWPWVNLLGGLGIGIVVLGAMVHTGMRIRSARGTSKQT